MINEDKLDNASHLSPNLASTHYETKEGFNPSSMGEKNANISSKFPELGKSKSKLLGKNNSSPFFKKLLNESPVRKKNMSILKAKFEGVHTHGDNGMQHDEATKFSKTIFNPKIKFFGTIQGGFYKQSKMNQSQSNFRLRTSTQNSGMKAYQSQTNFSKKTKTDKKDKVLNFKNIMQDKNFDMEVLNDTYKRANPLSGRISLTNTLYTMMKTENKDNIVYTPGDSTAYKSSGNNYECDLDDVQESNYIQNMLNVSNDEELIDAEEKKTVGEVACTNFYMHYKKLHKVKDQNNYSSGKTSVYTGMLDYCDDNKLLPMRNGVIKNLGNPNVLNVNNYLLGNRYIGMISEGIEKEEYKTIEMKNNKLSENGGKRILKTFNKNQRSLNLEKNDIRTSANLLKPILINPETKLQHLNLNKNSLGDSVVENLLVTLISNKNLVSLHLNENHLTDKIAEKLANLIYEHNRLKEVYFRWNKITSFGGKKIFERLSKNPELKVADFSWNLLGDSYKTLRTDNGFIDTFCTF